MAGRRTGWHGVDYEEQQRDTGRDRRRARARERRERQDVLAGELAPGSAPLVWGAGVGSRLLAVVWLALLVVFGPFAYDRDLAAFDWADWLFRGWGLAAGIWIHCRLSAWKITADRDGVAIPGLFTVDHIPWAGLGTVVPRRDGCLRVGDRMPGPFLPPFLARLLRRPVTVEAAADHLMVMARHPGLRPTGTAGARAWGPPYAVWLPGPLVVIAIPHLVALVR
ncbi:hypothetical protein [Streptomyces bacillaris]|uniref:hypothetical protein n=1 Tax=Streptomyces bacillaris TaxID=68179 RepID=UPI00381E95D6